MKNMIYYMKILHMFLIKMHQYMRFQVDMKATKETLDHKWYIKLNQAKKVLFLQKSFKKK